MEANDPTSLSVRGGLGGGGSGGGGSGGGLNVAFRISTAPSVPTRRTSAIFRFAGYAVAPLWSTR